MNTFRGTESSISKLFFNKNSEKRNTFRGTTITKLFPEVDEAQNAMALVRAWALVVQLAQPYLALRRSLRLGPVWALPRIYSIPGSLCSIIISTISKATVELKLALDSHGVLTSVSSAAAVQNRVVPENWCRQNHKDQVVDQQLADHQTMRRNRRGDIFLCCIF